LSARHHRLACACFFLFNGPAAAELYTLSLHDALPISTDLFLLASDGLTGMLEDPQLAELLAGKRVPQDQIDDLIAEANRHGGLDNITAIIVRIDAVDAPAGDTTQITQPGGRARPR